MGKKSKVRPWLRLLRLEVEQERAAERRKLLEAKHRNKEAKRYANNG